STLTTSSSLPREELSLGEAQQKHKREEYETIRRSESGRCCCSGIYGASSGAMAQGRRGRTAGPNHYGPTNNPGVNTHMSQQGDNSSLFGRTNAEENKPTVSDEKVTSSGREPARRTRRSRNRRTLRSGDRHLASLKKDAFSHLATVAP